MTRDRVLKFAVMRFLRIQCLKSTCPFLWMTPSLVCILLFSVTSHWLINYLLEGRDISTKLLNLCVGFGHT
jgi:hypothetical protein